MIERTARQIVLAARPQGRVQLSDFRVEETTLPVPGAGQILLAVQYLSLDPYMRGRMDDRKSYAKPVQIGEVMVGESVATVIASNHSGYAQGDTVVAPTGWRTHCLSDGTGLRKLDATLAPVTTALGVLGMPGFTAYSGLHLIGKPSPGETVVVAAASGPVGSLVGQLAKIAGATTLGVNSTHHQAVGRVAGALRAVVQSADGVIEALELKDPGQLPFLLTVQFHPERMVDGKAVFLQLFRSFVHAAARRNERNL